MNQNIEDHKCHRHYKCNRCELEFNTKRELHQHKIDMHYGDQIYKCICGKEFHSKRSLGTHKQRCSDVLKQNGLLLEVYRCSGCGREFKTKTLLQSHIGHCKKYEKLPYKGLHSSKYWNTEKQLYICECGKEFEKHQSLNAHFCFCMKHKHEWNLPETICQSKIRKGDRCNFSKAYLGEEKAKALQEKSRQTIARNIKSGKVYKFNFNTNVKQGWYKGFYCDSSWELAFVIYCLEHNLNIKKCDQVFTYMYKGKLRRYYPDFEIDGIIYEIKGYENELAKIKHKLFPFIKYLKQKDMKKYLDYVIEKYGKKFYELYESKPPIL